MPDQDSQPAVRRDRRLPRLAAAMVLSRQTARVWAAVLGLLLLHAVFVIDSSRQKSAVVDEVSHLPAGLAWEATDGAIQLNPQHPPLVKRLAGFAASGLEPSLPLVPPPSGFGAEWIFGQRVLYLEGADALALLQRGRLPTLALSWLGALAVFAWSRHRWGDAAGLFSLFLWCTSPSILAHARWVTFDLPLAALWVATLYGWWRLLVREADPDLPPSALSDPQWLGRVATGIALGAALGTKFSAPLLLPAMAAIELALEVGVADRPFFASARRRLGRWVTVLAIATVTLWAIYDFPLDPSVYLDGLTRVYGDIPSTHQAYFDGRFAESFPLYFVWTLALKSSLLELALFAIAAGMTIVRSRGAAWRDDLALWLPAFLWLVAMSVVARNMGHRYTLSIYPLLFILAGGALPWARATLRKPLFRGLVAVCCALQLSGLLAHHPHYLPYFHRLAGGVDCGPWWLDDSNVDWAQDLAAAGPWLASHGVEEVMADLPVHSNPGAYGIAARPFDLSAFDLEVPRDGAYLISASKLARGLAQHRETVVRETGDREIGAPTDWIERYTPRDVLGGSLYLYIFPQSAEPPSAEEKAGRCVRRSSAAAAPAR